MATLITDHSGKNSSKPKVAKAKSKIRFVRGSAKGGLDAVNALLPGLELPLHGLSAKRLIVIA
jgi:hypothetical protein